MSGEEGRREEKSDGSSRVAGRGMRRREGHLMLGEADDGATLAMHHQRLAARDLT